MASDEIITCCNCNREIFLTTEPVYEVSDDLRRCFGCQLNLNSKNYALGTYEQTGCPSTEHLVSEGYKSGYTQGRADALAWKKYPEQKPTRTQYYPIFWDGDGAHMGFWHNDLQEWDCEVIEWFDLKLPGGEND